jgi:hypothetical protein
MQGRRRLACHAQLLGQSHNAIAVQSNLTHNAKIALHSLARGNQQQPTLHTAPPNATRDCVCSLEENALVAPRAGSGKTLAATTLTPSFSASFYCRRRKPVNKDPPGCLSVARS